MNLRDYLHRQRMTVPQFAKLVDFPVATVRKWVRQERLPRRDAMRRISDATAGEVTYADMAGMPAGAAPQVAA